MYRVIVTPEAEQDLRRPITSSGSGAPQAARAWMAGARKKIKTLSEHPERAHLAPESRSFHEPIRELLYGSGNRGTYRILFVVLDKPVFILHIRHGSMLPITPEE